MINYAFVFLAPVRTTLSCIISGGAANSGNWKRKHAPHTRNGKWKHNPQNVDVNVIVYAFPNPPWSGTTTTVLGSEIPLLWKGQQHLVANNVWKQHHYGHDTWK